MPLERLILVFLDGVGLGPAMVERNPLARFASELEWLTAQFDGRSLTLPYANTHSESASLLGLDATLGVAGLPQSATGQATILSGHNAAEYLGQHDGPYPNHALKTLLDEHNLFAQLKAAGKRVQYVNAYPPQFHARLGRGTARLSANTYAAVSAGLSLGTAESLAAGRSLSPLLTNHHWRQWGYDVPLLTPAQAGARLVALAEGYHLSYFEFWQTDVVGHRQDWAAAQSLLHQLDDFLRGAVTRLPGDTLLLVLSDHGNFEDLGTKQHTFNPALGLAFGPHHRQAQSLGSLLEVTPFVVGCLG